MKGFWPGEHDQRKEHESDTLVTEARSDFRIHNSYRPLLQYEGYVEYDVATLELRTPVDFHSYPHIRPACLPQVSSSDANVVISASLCVRIRVPQF